MSYSTEKKFKALCQITRAAHFEWRETFKQMFPEKAPAEAVMKYWEIVGHDTAKAYLKRIDPAKPVPAQIAQCIVASSLAMGEEARVLPGASGREAYFEHLSCPWCDWHKRYDAVEEDQPGCDRWIATLLSDINEALGTDIEFETLSSLPEGGGSCKRVLREKNGE